MPFLGHLLRCLQKGDGHAAGAAILGIVQPRQITQQTGSLGGPWGHGRAVHAGCSQRTGDVARLTPRRRTALTLPAAYLSGCFHRGAALKLCFTILAAGGPWEPPLHPREQEGSAAVLYPHLPQQARWAEGVINSFCSLTERGKK